MAVAQHFWRTHDFKLFKQNFRGANDKIKFLADLGFLGISDYHKNSEIPMKGSKYKPLTDEGKQFNRELSSRRVFVEHVFGWVKRFKILSYKYRNKRRRHGLRVALICGVYNAELG